MLLERGVITAAEVDSFIGPSWDDNPTVQLGPGDVVTVRAEDTATRFRKVCHARTVGVRAWVCMCA
jgi:hypothetical protein